MRFAFSKTAAKQRGWVVLKPWLIVRPAKTDLLVGLCTDAPPSGRRIYFYTKPLFAPEFSLSSLSFSVEQLSGDEGTTEGNLASTTKLIDRFAAKVDRVANDETFQRYHAYLHDEVGLNEGEGTQDFYCLVQAYIHLMAGNVERARERLHAFESAPPLGKDRTKLKAAAEQLGVFLAGSLDDAKVALRRIAAGNRRSVGLPDWAAA